jgi:hypothetical protein
MLGSSGSPSSRFASEGEAGALGVLLLLLPAGFA